MQTRRLDPALFAPPPLKPAEFEQIRRLAHEHFGLDLKHGKQNLVVTRLMKELRRLGMTSFDEYFRHVSEDSSGEALGDLADALTTNFTSFLREQSHFDFLRTKLTSQLPKGGPVEIWSTACSTGEEAYSILFTLLEAMGPLAEVRVLGTDISKRALQAAAQATYESSRVSALPQIWLNRYFLKGNGRWQGWWRVRPDYRAKVTFRRFNLVSDQPGITSFPVIFCRNVAIYFDKPTQAAVIRKVADSLSAGGHLFIGHSESLAGMDRQLAYVQPAVYRKLGRIA
jgi:chemotaxis protein methyltransferase CheR